MRGPLVDVRPVSAPLALTVTVTARSGSDAVAATTGPPRRREPASMPAIALVTVLPQPLSRRALGPGGSSSCPVALSAMAWGDQQQPLAEGGECQRDRRGRRAGCRIR